MTLIYWALFAAVAVYLAAEIYGEVARRQRARREAREWRRWEHLFNLWCAEMLFREQLRDEVADRRRLAA